MTDEETFDIEEASDLKEEEKKFKTKLSGNLEQKLAQHNENMFQVLRAIKKTHTIAVAVNFLFFFNDAISLFYLLFLTVAYPGWFVCKLLIVTLSLCTMTFLIVLYNAI